jgi:hypothetical protein
MSDTEVGPAPLANPRGGDYPGDTDRSAGSARANGSGPGRGCAWDAHRIPAPTGASYLALHDGLIFRGQVCARTSCLPTLPSLAFGQAHSHRGCGTYR